MAIRRLRIGTRGSKLALVQANQAADGLRAAHTGLEVEIVEIKSEGDADRTTPLAQMGGQGAFTRKIESELLDGGIDLAVHSAKDMPATMPEGLTIAAVPPRAPVEDVLLTRDSSKLSGLPAGAIVGTGSPRRAAQVLHLRGDLDVRGIRGNVGTRLAKLAEGEYDALLMARAGLYRLGMEDSVSEILPADSFIPAAGQGAILVQSRTNDAAGDLGATIDHAESRRCLEIERQLLRRLQAGCSVALGGWARFEAGSLRLSAVALDNSGATRLFETAEIDPSGSDAELVAPVADALIARGALDLIKREDI